MLLVTSVTSELEMRHWFLYMIDRVGFFQTINGSIYSENNAK